MVSRMAVVRWLLDSDPSIRWQVMRDLTDETDAVVASERSRVASEGWGAQLGGTVATHLRAGSPVLSHMLFGVYLGVMLWGGLYLRDHRLCVLIPYRR